MPGFDDADDAADEADARPPLIVKIALFARRAPTPEPQCDRFRAEALRRGHEVRDADVAAFVAGDVEIDVDRCALWVGGTRVDDVDAVILGALPGPAARTAPPGVTSSSEQHAARTTLQYERHVLAWSMAYELEARGIPVLSSPSRARPFDFKPAQLLALRRAGLPVPSTSIGARPIAALDAIEKPVSGGPVRSSSSSSSSSSSGAMIRQPRLRGIDLRAVVIGGEVVVVGRFPGDDDVIDLRERPAFIDGSARWERDHHAPTAELARAAVEVCCCDFAAVDLKRDGETITILEVNRTPVVVDLEDDLGAGIAARFIDEVEARVR